MASERALIAQLSSNVVSKCHNTTCINGVTTICPSMSLSHATYFTKFFTPDGLRHESNIRLDVENRGDAYKNFQFLTLGSPQYLF